MGVSLLLEALAWQQGLLGLERMPDGMRVPYVGVTVDDADGSAWIVMEDISDALQAAGAPGTPDEQFERAKVILDRLARWHVGWEQPDRKAILERCPWLVQQDSRLWWGADHFAAALGINPRHPERVLNPSDPAMRELSRRCVRVFWDMLTEAQRQVWKKHPVNRDDLVAACADLPRTLIHGDCGSVNMGLRMGEERTELLLIDWEWTAVASPAFDIWYYALSVAGPFSVHAMDMRSALCAYDYGRCLAHGGKAMDEATWERACALASIFEGLRAFPPVRGRRIL